MLNQLSGKECNCEGNGAEFGVDDGDGYDDDGAAPIYIEVNFNGDF